MLRNTTRRPGFTLVELMVAAAVCVLIMAVLATAFQLGIDTMRQMKSTGDLVDQLRGATNVLQYDLKAKHVLDDTGRPQKLSSLDYNSVTVTDNGAMATPRYTVNNWKPPASGFFRVASAPYTVAGNASEGADADGLMSFRFTNHYLHFTAVQLGQSDEDYYAATVPVGGRTYFSTAVEIAYFLDPAPIGTTPGGTPLFRLIRRQRLAAINDTDRRDRPWPPAPPAIPSYPHDVLSLRQPSQGAAFLSTLAELTNPSNRLGGTRWTSATNQVGPGYAPVPGPQDDSLAPMVSRPGEDTLLSNVISFEVQVQWMPCTDPLLAPFGTRPRDFTPSTATDDPFDTLPQVPATWTNAAGLGGTYTYDSWSSQLDWTSNFDPTVPDAKRPPMIARVQGVQIRIRIWDPKLQNARQVTITQDL